MGKYRLAVLRVVGDLCWIGMWLAAGAGIYAVWLRHWSFVGLMLALMGLSTVVQFKVVFPGLRTLEAGEEDSA